LRFFRIQLDAGGTGRCASSYNGEPQAGLSLLTWSVDKGTIVVQTKPLDSLSQVLTIQGPARIGGCLRLTVSEPAAGARARWSRTIELHREATIMGLLNSTQRAMQ
jgi:hypothetical protein